MSTLERARSAYATSASHRDPRAQEADVFRRVTGALRASGESGSIARAKALADNRRLWITVGDLMRDPDNRLPDELKASIASIGGAVLRELDGRDPDVSFLASINDSIAEGLSQT